MAVRGAMLLALCCLVLANDKKIDLEDIERDNLKSEKTTEEEKSRSEYLNVEQSTQYGTTESDKNQYAVEEPNPTETSQEIYSSKSVVYHPTVSKYGDAVRSQQQSVSEYSGNQISNSEHYYQQPDISGLDRIPMAYILVPQISSASNNIALYSGQYHENQPGVNYQYRQVYQPVNSYANQHEDVQTHSTSVKIVHPEYSSSPEEEVSHDHQEYVSTAPQYQEQSQYSETPLEFQKYSALSQKYTPFYEAPRQHLYTQVDYKISPQPGFYRKPSSLRSHSKPDETPKVLPQYAHSVSNPIYSHISGNLGKDHYKSPYSVTYDDAHYVPHGNGIEHDFKPMYSYSYGRKPTSLLDSYIPSSLQIEYLKRGLSKEPLATYDLIASQGYKYENGFTPNQMYATPDGGIIYKNFRRHARDALKS